MSNLVFTRLILGLMRIENLVKRLKNIVTIGEVVDNLVKINYSNLMLYYLVIGVCIFLLLAVIYISAKPISMGIEARRNLNEKLPKQK